MTHEPLCLRYVGKAGLCICWLLRQAAQRALGEVDTPQPDANVLINSGHRP